MSKQVKAAVIGAGQIGYSHIEGLNSHPECEVVAIAEKSPERLAAAADKFNVSGRFTDYKKVLKDKNISVVSIALPNALHAPVAIAALKAGKHVFCDKPMALSYREALKVKKTVDETGLFFMVGMNFRFKPEVQALKQIIARGDIGDVFLAHAQILRQYAIPKYGTWFTRKSLAGGGATLDIGVHFLDLALHLIGSFDAEAVSGSIYDKYGTRGIGKGSWGMSDVEEGPVQFDVDDNLHGLIKLKGGKTVIIQAAWHVYRSPFNSLFISGTDGGVMYPDIEILIRDGDKHRTVKGANIDLKASVATDRMVHFIDCVLNRSLSPLVPIGESMKVQRILNALYTSSETGREVRIKD